jgi:hypothetical protein
MKSSAKNASMNFLKLLASATIAAFSTAAAFADDAALSLDAIATERGSAVLIDPPSLTGLGAKSASLSLVFKNAGQPWSDQQRAGRSIVVMQAGQILTQVELSPERWSYEMSLPRVPSSATITASMVDASGRCVAGNLSDMIDLPASRLEAELDPRGTKLDAIPALLGVSFPKDRPLTIWTPHGLEGTDRLTAALSITEGFVFKFRGAAPKIDVAKLSPPATRQAGPLPGADIGRFKGPIDVVLGTTGDLKGWAAESILAEIAGPYIGIATLPGTPSRWIVLVSGRNRHELDLAAKAFANPDFVWPQGRAVLLADDGRKPALSTLPGVIWGPDHSSSPATVYSFKDLGYPTTSSAGEVKIPLVTMLGTDNINPESEVVLHPAFIYGAGYQSNASWQVFVGKTFLGSISLSAAGGSTADTAVRIPVKHLEKGANILRLVPILPEGADNCLKDNPSVPATWLGDGTVETPWIGGGRIRASLSAFATTGHLNPAASQRPIRIVVESTEDDTVAAALTIAARIVKAARGPIPGLVLSASNEDAPEADLVMVGTHEWAASILKTKPESMNAEIPEWQGRSRRPISGCLRLVGARRPIHRHRGFHFRQSHQGRSLSPGRGEQLGEARGRLFRASDCRTGADGHSRRQSGFDRSFSGSGSLRPYQRHDDGRRA